MADVPKPGPMEFYGACATVAFGALALKKRVEALQNGMAKPNSLRELEALTFLLGGERELGLASCEGKSPTAPVIADNLPKMVDRAKRLPSENPDCPEQVQEFEAIYGALISQYERSFPNGPPGSDIKIPLELEKGLEALNEQANHTAFMCGRGPEKMPALKPFGNSS